MNITRTLCGAGHPWISLLQPHRGTHHISRLACRFACAIEPLPHLFGCLEERNAFVGHGNPSLVRGLRPMRAGRCLAENAPSPRSSTRSSLWIACGNFAQNGVDDVIDVALIKLRILTRYSPYEFGLDHVQSNFYAVSAQCSRPQRSRGGLCDVNVTWSLRERGAAIDARRETYLQRLLDSRQNAKSVEYRQGNHWCEDSEALKA